MINKCSFSNLTSYEGGALHVQSKEITITNSIFVNNTALTNGGSVVIKESDRSVLINNTFENNKALVDGGALLFDCHSFAAQCFI
jgi:parallel beta-helix repeat protein